MDGLSFDLVNEAWLPVIKDGVSCEVSLQDALLEAHTISEVVLANPLELVAVIRQVLLPVYLDACGLPDSEQAWLRRWREPALPQEPLRDYLAAHRSRFDLFGAEPFGQVAGLRTAKDETKPVSLLIAAMPSGNNVPLFAARTEADPPALTVPQALLALLAAQCWDTAAIKSGAADDPVAGKAGKTTGNPTGPCGALGVIVPLGRTLAETLLLNAPIVRQPPRDDLPQWRWPAPTGRWETRPATGLLDLLTWQSRRVRLVPERDADGGVVVRRVVLTAGDRLERLPIDVEPHTAWRQVDKPRAGQSPVSPVRHVPGRDAWRGFPSMLPVRGAVGKTSAGLLLDQLDRLYVADPDLVDVPLRVLTVGVLYGNQSAVVEDVMSEITPLPMAALHPDSEVRLLVDRVVGHVEALRRAGNDFADNVRRASGGDPLPWDKGHRAGDALVHEYGVTVRRMLVGLQRDPDRYDEAEDAWRVVARRQAEALVDLVMESAPPAAFAGRTVKQTNSDKKTEYRLTTAAAWYRASVRKILGADD